LDPGRNGLYARCETDCISFFPRYRVSAARLSPALWQRTDVEKRHRLISIIERNYRDHARNLWGVEQVKEIIAEGVALADISKLRACYHFQKTNKEVLCATVEEKGATVEQLVAESTTEHTSNSGASPAPPPSEVTVNTNPTTPGGTASVSTLGSHGSHQPVLDERKTKMKRLDTHFGFSYKPKDIVQTYVQKKVEAQNKNQNKEERESCATDKAWEEAKWSYFDYLTNHVAKTHVPDKHGKLLPSACLDVEVSSDQIRMMEPSMKDLRMSSIMAETVGPAATKKMAKRRLDMISANIASHARILNSESEIKSAKEHLELAESLSKVSEEARRT